MGEVNTLVAVSNGKSAVSAEKFLVHLSVCVGEKQYVLADQVFYRDGLVLMEGVTSIHSVTSNVKALKRIHTDIVQHNGSCTTSINIETYGHNDAEKVLYGRCSSSLIIGRNCVGLVDGLLNLDTLELPWLRVKEEAQALANDAQDKVNQEIRILNGQAMRNIAEHRRQVRAYESWRALPWFVRIITGLKGVVEHTPASTEDWSWVAAHADRLGVEYTE